MAVPPTLYAESINIGRYKAKRCDLLEVIRVWDVGSVVCSLTGCLPNRIGSAEGHARTGR